jgi:hypothetical protein
MAIKTILRRKPPESFSILGLWQRWSFGKGPAQGKVVGSGCPLLRKCKRGRGNREKKTTNQGNSRPGNEGNEACPLKTKKPGDEIQTFLFGGVLG